LYEAEIPGIPTNLILSNKTGGMYLIATRQRSEKRFDLCELGPTKSEIVYGTSDGRLGQVEIGRLVR
jgi:hypothetical protein